MEKLILQAETRSLDDKAQDLRLAKKVPAVVYGHNVEPTHITVENSEFLRLFRKSGLTHIVELDLNGKKQNVLVHEVQHHPVSGDFLHIDFFVVSATEKIHVQVPVKLVGDAGAARDGALIELNLHAIDMKCLPSDLLDAVEVDIAKLEHVGDIIHVRDLGLNEKKYTVLSPASDAVVSAHAPKKHGTDEAETAPVATAASVAPAA